MAIWEGKDLLFFSPRSPGRHRRWSS